MLKTNLLAVAVAILSGLFAPTSARAADDPADAPVAKAACREGRGDANRCASYSYYLHKGIGVAADHAQGLRYARMACERKSGAGCLNAAVVLRWSDTVPQNLPEALQFAERGCALSYGSACLMLGNMRRDGIGALVNSRGAVQAFDQACAQGKGEGCRLAGRLYADGFGDVPQNEVVSVASLRSGCRLGDMESCALVGYMSQNGRGMTRDADLSVREYMRACASKVDFACGNIEGIRRAGAGTFGYAELMAREVTARAFPPQLPAEQRFILASATLGRDPALAIAGYQVLAEDGLADAAYALGQIYYSGQGAPQDVHKAVQYFKQAADRNHPYAQFVMAHFYRSGFIVGRNEIWSIQMMRAAHETGGLAEAGPIWRAWQNEMDGRYEERDRQYREMRRESEESQRAAESANMARLWGLYSGGQNRQENGQVCGIIYRNNQAHQECMARETFDNYYNPNR